ncbi:hypothetical protein QBC35DRAFT_530843 [Podospora australis]|uniref:Glutamate carboxypeptidase 2 n=1 Tax=Podospora australis TaxID=1536484 RepID=A0AAN6WXP2_9PEZI|nr:hypothetical protein QBC35DRAFT_530843 [Podospora australis]
MAPGRDQQDDLTLVPPIPTYEEAVAGGSSDWQQRDLPRSPIDDSGATEGHSLLNSRHPYDSSTPTPSQNARGRRPAGYRAPTVETDDESNLFSSDDSDSDSDSETNHVRREMQEMEIDDSHVAGNRSSWGKRIGLSLSLPQWRWRWKWKLPRLRGRGRTTVSTDANGTETSNNAESETPGTRFGYIIPKLGSTALFLLVGRILAILIVLGFLWLIFASDMFSGMARKMNQGMFDPNEVAIFVKEMMNGERIRDQLREYTRFAHLAGTEGDYALMLDTERLFTKYGLDEVQRDPYAVYLNYPTRDGRAVEIIGDGGKTTWKAELEEEDVNPDKPGRQTFAFHAHSKAGDVKGPLLYANYGRREDFKWLQDQGFDTKGAIALVRYGDRTEDISLKVKAAEEAGFAGCIMYNDPYLNVEVSVPVIPNDRPDWPNMPGDGVRRGSVSFRNWVVGDVLTPGWGSKDNMPRMKVAQTAGLPKIPSLPLSIRDAQFLLTQLRDHGKKTPEGWSHTTGSLFTGDPKSSPVVRLKNLQDEVEKQLIWNIYGRITGVEQEEKKIMIGSHRDALGFGAAGSQSGTAVMLEVIRVFGNLAAKGWRPSRTIEFMSWDGSDYNLIGSTEFVEQNDDALRKDAFAYINLGAAVTGNVFRAAGSPVFSSIIRQVLAIVDVPQNDSVRMLDLWDARKGELETLGMTSDYVAFQDIVGTSSIDLHFDGPYPIHSNYDDGHWIDLLGAPDFPQHQMLAQVVGLLILELSNRPIMPFDMTSYAEKLDMWIRDLESWAVRAAGDGTSHQKLKLDGVKEAINEVSMAAREFKKWEQTWENQIVSANGWEPNGLGKSRCEYNSRMAEFESNLLDEAGIPGRAQFKHVIFGPQKWSTDGKDYFPSIRDAVTSGNWTLAQITADKVAKIIKDAAKNLNS